MVNEEIQKYQRLLIQYFKKSHPEKLRLNPRVLEVTKTHVKFGMQKHLIYLSETTIFHYYLTTNSNLGELILQMFPTSRSSFLSSYCLKVQ